MFPGGGAGAGAGAAVSAEGLSRVTKYLVSRLDSYPAAQQAIIQTEETARQRLAILLDQSVPFVTQRWGGTLLLCVIYCLRVYIIEGFHIVTYALAIYYLSLFVGFLSPLENMEDHDEDGPHLPSHQDDEFKPFIRRLPEFKFWFRGTRALLLAFLATFFRIFDIPVFWPILLMYFIVLFFATMKNLVQHMIKHKYIPFDWGKKVYRGVGTEFNAAADARSTSVEAATEVFKLGGNSGSLGHTHAHAQQAQQQQAQQQQAQQQQAPPLPAQ